MHILPSDWQPATIEDLIGEPRRVGRILRAKIARMGGDPRSKLKQLFYGPPGTGKSSLASLLARQIAGAFALEKTCGQDVDLETVREWERALSSPSLFGGWQVKYVDEIDLMPPSAQNRLLEYLDRMPAMHAFFGTSNQQIDGLQERFQTRLQPWKIDAPSTEEIIEFLLKHWPQLTRTAARAIAVGSGGNVRAACLDAESELDVQLAA